MLTFCELYYQDIQIVEKSQLITEICLWIEKLTILSSLDIVLRLREWLLAFQKMFQLNETEIQTIHSFVFKCMEDRQNF